MNAEHKQYDLDDMPGVWVCGECGTEYETEDEAEECCTKEKIRGI